MGEVNCLECCFSGARTFILVLLLSKKIEVLKLQMDLKIRMSEFFNNYQKVPILNYLRQNIVA